MLSEFVLLTRFNSYGGIELYRYWLLIVLNITSYLSVVGVLLILNIVTDP